MITFAPKADDLEGRMHSIESVASGKECGCVCSCCHAPLIARNRQPPLRGRKRAMYFAHASGADCEGASETALHRTAKQVLADTKLLYLPALEGKKAANCSEFHEWVTGELRQFSSVSTEVHLDGFRPDAVVENGGTKIFIEFLVSHAVDDAKLAKLRSNAYPCVEVDLRSFLGQPFKYEEIAKALQDPAIPRSWLAHPEGMRWARIMATQTKTFRQCPHGLGGAIPDTRFTAFSAAPCSQCPCFLGPEKDEVQCLGAINAIDRRTLARADEGLPNPVPDFIARIQSERQRAKEQALARANYRPPALLPTPRPTEPKDASTADARLPAPAEKEPQITSKVPVRSTQFCMTCGSPAIAYPKPDGRTLWLCSKQPRFHVAYVLD